ncbi:excisionase family DNA binding protein [Humibacillus xanthopallidus]|uniref:Excisionase family DNA binding protein n=1 Tax=Humibacillus xanthopallidus TaxID=412689 RepID=A0A543PMM1_9MICO|nr:helix-turn-helix domain-containing protein [Humibacillus xanthopallidus]TQN45331.1 excisionase family DNA binding protein [Humibacillus xanthopallidus]
MRNAHVDDLVTGQGGELLSTGEVAHLLGTSRQHVVNLCDAGLLPYALVGRHRRIRRSDVELARSGSQRLSRDQRRSLWIGTAVAGKLVTDPARVLTQARKNLVQLRTQHRRGQAQRWLDDWEHLLSGPLEAVVEVLTAKTPYAREMRQNSPFANVLTQDERLRVINNFTHEVNATKVSRQGAQHWTQAEPSGAQALPMATPEDDAWMQ